MYFFALVKVTVFEEKEEDSKNIIDFICLGVENYKADKAGISFKFLFMNLSNKPMTKSFGFNENITYLKNSTDPNSSTTEHRNSKCTSESTKQDDDYLYYSCIIPISNISNITQISIWH